MFNKDKDERKVNTKKVNELVITSNRILSILYILFIILLVYVVSLIFKEWGILSFIGKMLSMISPLFIGFLLAWLLNPMVQKLQKRGINRTISVIISYLVLVVGIYLIFAFTIPSLGTQISDILAAVPNIVEDVKGWIDNIFLKLSNLSLQNLDNIKSTFMLKINTFAQDIEKGLPSTAMNIVSALASGIGKILLSLILGFYILFDYDKFKDNFIKLFPKKYREEVKVLASRLSESLFSFVNGTLWLSLLLFVVSIIGLNAPVLISFICVVTNLIPYIGPYMGAAVAGAIGFAESPLIGTLTLIFILVVQTIDGNLLQPLIMSKKMNLSPITIIISLIVFEYFFGIIGMVIATPVVAILKVIYEFFDEKFGFFEYADEPEIKRKKESKE